MTNIGDVIRQVETALCDNYFPPTLEEKEILNNILKHAAATEIRISMKYTPDFFLLLIRDNGKGFDRKETVNRTIADAGSGLQNLQKRAALVGADLQINSSPGEGTDITISLPKPIQDAK